VNREEVAKLLAGMATVDQMAPQPHPLVLDVWASLLADVPFAAAERAFVEWYRHNSTTITPEKIVTWYADQKRAYLNSAEQVREQQRALTERDRPDFSPKRIHDGVDRVFASLAHRKAIAAGTSPDELDGVGEGEAGVRRLVQSVPCPHSSCHAGVGQRCIGPSGKPLTKTFAHPSRVDAAYSSNTTEGDVR
jgi:hypothetical protein